MTPPPVQDELMVLAAQDGDAVAMGALVLRWHGALLRHAGRLLASGDDARDAVQDAWVGIVRGLHRLGDPARFAAWALRITACACTDVLRRRGRQRHAETAATAEPTTDDAPPEGDQAEGLRRAVRALPAERRVPVELHYLEGLGVADIAEVLGIPPGTVKSRLFHARSELRAALAGSRDAELPLPNKERQT